MTANETTQNMFEDEESMTEEEQSIQSQRNFEIESPKNLSSDPAITKINYAPEWLIFNSHIVHGYRVNHEKNKSIFKSIFQLHNETTNIWTHLLGSIIFVFLFIYTFRYFNPLETEYKKFLVYLQKVDWDKFSGALHYTKIVDFVQHVRKNKGFEFYEKIAGVWEANQQYLGNVKNTHFKEAIASFMNRFPSIFGKETMDHINEKDLEAFSTLFKAVKKTQLINFFKAHFKEMILHIPKFPLMLFEVCAIICFTASSLMHIFWVKSKEACEKYHKLDLCGIVIMICGSSLSVTFFQFYCTPTIRDVYIVLGLIGALSVIYTLVFGCHFIRENGAFSVATFILQSILCMIPYIHWIEMR